MNGSILIFCWVLKMPLDSVTEYFLDLPIKVYPKYLKVYFLFHCFISGELSVYSFRKKTWKIVDKIVERFSYADCGKEESIYINWWCTLDNKTIGKETNSTWDNLKNQLLQNDDSITTVTLQCYGEVETVTKNGKTAICLKTVSTNATFFYYWFYISMVK